MCGNFILPRGEKSLWIFYSSVQLDFTINQGDFDDDNLQLVKRFLTSKPDFNRQVNETALNMQPDNKDYKYATVYLIFAYLYGCGFEPDIEKAEEYAEKSEALGDEKAAVWKARIEAVKNGK